MDRRKELRELAFKIAKILKQKYMGYNKNL